MEARGPALHPPARAGMDTLPLFPLNTVLFPGATLPLQIFEPRYLTMVRRCVDGQAPFGVVLIRSGKEVGGNAEPYEVGTTARIVEVKRLGSGRLHIIARGMQRFRIVSTSQDQPYLTGEVELLSDRDDDSPLAAGAMDRAATLFREYTQAGLAINGEWSREIALPARPGALADFVASRLELEATTHQRLLEELSVLRRLAIERRLLEPAVQARVYQLEGARRARYGAFGVWN